MLELGDIQGSLKILGTWEQSSYEWKTGKTWKLKKKPRINQDWMLKGEDCSELYILKIGIK
jgi:hypothetical protein